MDTSVQLVLGPSDQVDQFYNAIPGASIVLIGGRFHAFPCNTVPTIAFQWGGGQEWAISSEK